ncbi:uncharacterized protein TRAVEDRAFT_22894 [Trametes versicolor FP-101664 SS1]|uniref:uncharacterized protein n=1 Tax=Trametes versicolor (strain FP-101664) TaxID=717944 RepID=UPI0004621FB9|nr:uncharacterized protein TRAVEDRAFT_22894 [Trametes versicolor FP-101664 SS1]EIW55123.1 hypothetical protein TRAVEDRAFT_22894 [Trametes versicolor FP-101664 SS1]
MSSMQNDNDNDYASYVLNRFSCPVPCDSDCFSSGLALPLRNDQGEFSLIDDGFVANTVCPMPTFPPDFPPNTDLTDQPEGLYPAEYGYESNPTQCGALAASLPVTPAPSGTTHWQAFPSHSDPLASLPRSIWYDNTYCNPSHAGIADMLYYSPAQQVAGDQWPCAPPNIGPSALQYNGVERASLPAHPPWFFDTNGVGAPNSSPFLGTAAATFVPTRPMTSESFDSSSTSSSWTDTGSSSTSVPTPISSSDSMFSSPSRHLAPFPTLQAVHDSVAGPPLGTPLEIGQPVTFQIVTIGGRSYMESTEHDSKTNRLVKRYCCAYNFPGCTGRFSKPGNLRAHQSGRAHNRDPIRWKCDQCHCSYSRQDALRKHVGKKHCHKRYRNRPGNLREHQREAHDPTFTQSQRERDLQTHIKTHHQGNALQHAAILTLHDPVYKTAQPSKGCSVWLLACTSDLNGPDRRTQPVHDSYP